MPYASIHYPFENQQKFEDNYPAQFISEYIAQTRAWFYTMHVMSVGIFGKAAVENTLTTGTIMAHDGSKMSKSKRNFPDPMVLIDKYGVDSLRLYLMSSSVMKSENINFDEKEVADIRKNIFVVLWNTFNFYRQFADIKAGFALPTNQPDHVMDKWLLSVTQSLISNVTKYYESYDLVRASRSLMDFVGLLSTWYLRLSRERLKSRQSSQPSQVFGYAIYTLCQMMAPLAPFFTEVIHQLMVDPKSSIHLTNWPELDKTLINTQLDQAMSEIQKAVELIHSQRKAANIKVRQPLAQATTTSTLDTPDPELLEVLAQEVNIKKIVWKKGQTLNVELDTKLTPELIEEGQAREVMRSIQALRKTQHLKAGDQAEVTWPEWPESWTKQIEAKTNSQLVRGPEPKLRLID